MRKVKCIDSGIHKITNGRVYEVRCEDGTAFNITDDESNNVWLSDTRFEDVPDTITFASQEEFENAVMEVVLKRLGVQTLTFDKWGRKFTEQYSKSVVYDTVEKL